jgi:hypothetical protein
MGSQYLCDKKVLAENLSGVTVAIENQRLGTQSPYHTVKSR